MSSEPGSIFWEALQFLALADPSEMVAMEAIRAMHGAPPPRAEPSIRKKGVGGKEGVERPIREDVGQPAPKYLDFPPPLGSALDQDLAAESVQSRVYGASWHMVMAAADETTLVPSWALLVGGGGSDVSGVGTCGVGHGFLVWGDVPSGT